MQRESAGDEYIRCRAILIVLWVLATVCAIRIATVLRPNSAMASVCRGLDPNRAPWWDLTLLPEIGPGTGRAIAALREHQQEGLARDPAPRRIFARPADLTRVKGIGPRTIERLGRYLRFDDSTTTGAMRLESAEQP